MKILNRIIKIYNPSSIFKILQFALFITIFGCASHKEQIAKDTRLIPQEEKRPTHTFYIAGGFGNMMNSNETDVMKLLKKELSEAPINSTLIFTGDNVSNKKHHLKEDEILIDKQLKLLSDFSGQTIFMPGKNEWKSKNIDSINAYDNYLKKNKSYNLKRVFKQSCPIERIEINDKLDLIVINSNWFLNDWDGIEGMNKACTDIVSRRRFLEEFEDYIKDSQGKNIVIAMHHPVFSNGTYAGHHTFKNQLLPAPVLKSVYSEIADLGAFSSNHLNNTYYYKFRTMITSLAQESDRITFVSGHENSLQFLKSDTGTSQIISGALTSLSATKRTKDDITAIGGTLNYEGIYTYSENGFAKLDYFEDGSATVTFHTISNDKNTKTFSVLDKMKPKQVVATDFKKQDASTIKTAVFSDDTKLNKSKTFEFIWGERHRSYYGKTISANVVMLDTLYGGLEVVRKGGGHQSYSLRLEDKNGKEYVMRSLRKNILKFLKYKLKGIAYNQDVYKSTIIEEVTSDFFTSAHPYMPLVINHMANAINVNHANTKLFYVPKQNRLGEYNEEYGDELYFIEERPSDKQFLYEGFNRANLGTKGTIVNFESTTDVLEKLKKDESYSIDERAHIRARIFDMLIGDWDRHESQWRWAEIKKDNGDIEFQSIPRDRDGAFSKFDGIGIPIIKLIMPDTRFWQTYSDDISSVKWFNAEGNNLDRALFSGLGPEVWQQEARAIQKELTDDIIENAFLRLPEEVRDVTASKFESDLKKRLEKLDQFALDYGTYLNKTVAIHATHKDDIIDIERLDDGNTRVILKRSLKNKEDKVFYDRVFDKSITKELWIYGLNDNDIFKVHGTGKSSIFIRLIGGYGDDEYHVENKSNLKIYDFKYEASKIAKKKPATFFTNQYKANTFHWRHFNENNNVILPNLGFRTDDGFVLGISNTYTNRGFNGDPFRQKHTLSANYYSEFQGVDLSYKGVWANLFPNWNFELEGYATNNRYSTNFFGIGNETQNLEDELDQDFYRSRMRQINISAGIAYRTIRFKALYENFKVDEIQSRLFTKENLGDEVFKSQSFVGAEMSFNYKNSDASDFPTRAFSTKFNLGYKANTDISENKFGYALLQISGAKKIIPSGDIVLSTTLETKTNFGDNYFYYHAPSIGGNNGLRGFRDERFTGKSYFYQSSDLRFRLKRYTSGTLPVSIGLYGGFDYGRVWLKNDNSNTWHTSQGGGLWISGLNSFALRIGYFNSDETNILQLGLGFKF